nr:unnamed protein product [Digitaria exilis]
MRHVGIPDGYSLTGVCNGFLCFAIDYDQAPVFVCNPVTGETLEVPKAPPLSHPKLGGGVTYVSHRFILGFSPMTKQYKVFRLSFPRYGAWQHNTIHIAVYTLGGSGGGWRQYSYPSQFYPMHSTPPPVHIDGDLFVPVERRVPERTARMLVLDVGAETRCLYSLPYNHHEGYDPSWDMLADGFDLKGQISGS